MNQPLVIIHCLVYNHESYLRDCFEGFVMQKTNFPFYAVVHDDCSTDNSAAIIREYAEKYPDIIHPIYETENQYSKQDGSLQRIMYEACKPATYIAMCEGDDYWTDPLKLQKQVDFLEINPNYSLVSHRMQVLQQNTGKFFEDCLGHCFEKDNEVHEITPENYFTVWANHPCTVVYRQSMYDFNDYTRFTYYRDANLFFNLLTHGRMACLSNISAVYRVHDGGVWSLQSPLLKDRLNNKLHRELWQVYQFPYLYPLYISRMKRYICSFLSCDENPSERDDYETITMELKNISESLLFFEFKILHLIRRLCGKKYGPKIVRFIIRKTKLLNG